MRTLCLYVIIGSHQPGIKTINSLQVGVCTGSDSEARTPQITSFDWSYLHPQRRGSPRNYPTTTTTPPPVTDDDG